MVNIATGRGATTGHALINHPKIAMVVADRTPSCPQLRPNHLAEFYRLIAETLDAIENNAVYINALPKMRTTAWNRGIYGAVRGGKGAAAANMLWIRNLSDGTHSLLDIAERAARLLKQHGLLRNAELKAPSHDPSRHN